MNRIFRETIDNSNWRIYFAELMLDWKDSMVKDDIKVMLPPVGLIVLGNRCYAKLCTGLFFSSIKKAGACINQRCTENCCEMKSTKISHNTCNIIC